MDYYVLEGTFFVALLIYAVYCLGVKNHDYWAKRGIQGPVPQLFYGTHKDLLLGRLSFAEFFRQKYEEFPGERYVGLLFAFRRVLMIRDPEVVRQVLVKDFDTFPDRAEAYDEKENPISAHLFNIEGIRWKNLRIKLSPTFTSGKIRRMFPLMMECAKELQGVLDTLAAQEEAVEMKNILARFSTDVIGSCSFGVNCNSLKNPDAEFRKRGLEFFENSLMNRLKIAILTPFPRVPLFHKLLAHRAINKFFLNLMKETIDYREKSDVKRGDFVDMLIEIKKFGKLVDDNVDLVEDPFLHIPISSSSEKLKFTDSLMMAQAFVFFAAGYESSATTMAFCLLELANNLAVQKKAQEDIDSALKKHGSVTYDALVDMSYLDKVISETLRKYPPAAALVRRCIKPYKLPHTNFTLEPETLVLVSLAGLHYDPKYYPEPELFDPERFSTAAKSSRPPYTYLPFGEGPRVCIGMRFGLVQTKLGLVTLLSQYEFRSSPLSRYPISFKKGTFVLAAVDGCHLYIKKRRNIQCHA